MRHDCVAGPSLASASAGDAGHGSEGRDLRIGGLERPTTPDSPIPAPKARLVKLKSSRIKKREIQQFQCHVEKFRHCRDGRR
jgi:hypothetical protein